MVMRLPGIRGIVSQRDQFAEQLDKFRNQMQFAPGHFYSPVASSDDVTQHFSELRRRALTDIAGIDLNLDEQRQWCERIASYYSVQPFSDHPTSDVRYYFDNQTFLWSDALFLYGMLRHLRPRRVVEVGSGFSSAVMLDTNERFCGGEIEMTFIEPYPERLNALLNAEDHGKCRIIQQRIQDVTDAPWKKLESGDILFVDSSHVSKCGSDVNQLFFEVLPSLAQGVVVHIHDVFPHFEYPEAWHRLGRSWNEDYLLRAFLQFNSSFRVLVWTPLMVESQPEFFAEKMPLCLRNSGGSFWMQRTT